MISDIIKLLNIGDLYGVSENIDIAKGKYKLPMTFKEGVKSMKRCRKK